MLGRYSYSEVITKNLLILSVLLCASFQGLSQTEPPADTTLNVTSFIDSTSVQLDTLSTDLESPIFYDANDSIIFDAINNRVLLYGTAVVKYDDIELTAARITYDFGNSTVSATGDYDSLGVYQNKPLLIQAGEEFRPDSLDFNFETEKAYISNVVTQNGEFYLISEQTKRDSSENVYLGKTKITTCDNPNPHFHFQTNKAALIPGKKEGQADKIVSGPVFLKVRKVPTPLALPFAWFPNSDKRSKGLIMPEFGNAQNQGYFLRGLGYYLPINDYLDTRILGDIYTRGGWALRNITFYKKRYKYQGNFDLSYSRNKFGFRDLTGFQENTDFFIRWTHTMDSKARPNWRFSSSINMGTSSNFTNNLNSTQTQFLTGTFNSSINVTRSGLNLFNRIPATITASARHTQNTQTRVVQFTLPQISLQTNRVYPFKSQRSGKKSSLKKAVEGIGVTYTGNFENRASLNEAQLRFNNLDEVLDQFSGGLRNQLSANTSIKAGVVSINPSFGLNSNIYRESLFLSYDPEANDVRRDTITGWDATYNWNASVNATTKLFGTYTFRKSKKLKAIRHTITPTAGFRYSPQTGQRITGFFGEDGASTSYTPQDINIFGTAANFTKNGALTLGLLNNLEMKVQGKEDKPKKVSLLDRVNVNTSRNFAADSLNWADLSVSASTNIGSLINVNYSSGHSLYDRDIDGNRINTFLLDSQDKLARATRMQGAVGLALSRTTFQRKDSEEEGSEDEQFEDSATDLSDEFSRELTSSLRPPTDFTIPWKLNLDYTLRRSYFWDKDLQKDTTTITQSILARGDITLFKKWKVGYSTGWDFTAKDFSATSISVIWDLHCWELKVDYIPFGIRQSVSINFNMKASMFRSLLPPQVLNLGNNNNLRR
ncbi:MAG: putative LPS assembly protein LptD [Flavobacteriales bacterium]